MKYVLISTLIILVFGVVVTFPMIIAFMIAWSSMLQH